MNGPLPLLDRKMDRRIQKRMACENCGKVFDYFVKVTLCGRSCSLDPTIFECPKCHSYYLHSHIKGELIEWKTTDEMKWLWKKEHPTYLLEDYTQIFV
jgi:hypothetical protein